MVVPVLNAAVEPQVKENKVQKINALSEQARDANRVLWSPEEEEPDRPRYDWRRLLIPLAIIIVSLILILLSLQGKLH